MAGTDREHDSSDGASEGQTCSSSAGSTSTCSGDGSSAGVRGTSAPWKGYPRVIYHDVHARVSSLKKARRLAAASTSASAKTRARIRRGSDEEDLRLVDLVVDPPGDVFEYIYDKADIPDFQVTVVDKRGVERLAVWDGEDMEPVPVGSILVMWEGNGAAALAAYLVGEEDYQRFIVGNGVACSPTLLTQEELTGDVKDGSSHSDVNGFSGGRDRAGNPIRRSGSAAAAATGSRQEYDDVYYDDDDDDDDDDDANFYGDFEDRRRRSGRDGGDGAGRAEMFAAVRRRAEEAREDALAMLTGQGEERWMGKGPRSGDGAGEGNSGSGASPTPHELFRRAADMGDPASFFYLALLQSAGLHGNEKGAGQAQARTWALCGADAFNTDANLLLAFRYQAGHREKKMCRHSVQYYQRATDDLRMERADDIQGPWAPPDMFRLGGEHGLGGWGVDLGGPGGAGVLEGRVPWSVDSARAEGGGGGMEARPQDMDPRDDLFLRAETGDPTAIMTVGYLYMTGSEEFAIEPDYAVAEQLMERAVRGGEVRAYGYLGWIHHHGHSRYSHHDQEGAAGNVNDARSYSGLDGSSGSSGDYFSTPKTEKEIQAYVAKRWGAWVLDEDRGDDGRGSSESNQQQQQQQQQQQPQRRSGGNRGVENDHDDDDDDNDDDDDDDDDGSDSGRDESDDGYDEYNDIDPEDTYEERHPHEVHVGPGVDVWRRGADRTYAWHLLGGGVSGAIRAADLYKEGYYQGDSGCATFLADLYMHGEFSDSRDGKSAAGKWSMLQAEYWYTRALADGKRYAEPQPVAAYRLGKMFQYGFIPYLGANMTQAKAFFLDADKDGGMDATLALAELYYYGHGGVFAKSCAIGSRYFKKYVDVCIKDDALARGRASFEEDKYAEAFLYYLVAAEQGSKEGQSSLAWLLNQGVKAQRRLPPSTSSRPKLSSINGGSFSRGLIHLKNLRDLIFPSSKTAAGEGADWNSDGNAWTGDSMAWGPSVGSWGRGLSEVVDAVRAMGGDPVKMAKDYRLLAAEQGDSDARCEIADDLYEKAKAKGAVPFGLGWLPGAKAISKKRNSNSSNNNNNNDVDKSSNFITPRKGKSNPAAASAATAAAAAAAAAAAERATGAAESKLVVEREASREQKSEDDREGRSEVTVGTAPGLPKSEVDVDASEGAMTAEERSKRDGIAGRKWEREHEDGQRLLGEAVRYYRMAAEPDRTEWPDVPASKRGLFSMGWLHQHGVGVELDHDLARDYYRRSASAPAALALFTLGASEFFRDAGEPLMWSIIAAAMGMWLMKRPRQQNHRPRPDERAAAVAAAGATTAAAAREVGSQGEVGQG